MNEFKLFFCFFLVGCSTTDMTTSAQVAGSYQSMTLWQTNPALATVGVYTPAVINTINPPAPIDESAGYLVKRNCGDHQCKKVHKIPSSQLPTKQDISEIKGQTAANESSTNI